PQWGTYRHRGVNINQGPTKKFVVLFSSLLVKEHHFKRLDIERKTPRTLSTVDLNSRNVLQVNAAFCKPASIVILKACPKRGTSRKWSEPCCYRLLNAHKGNRGCVPVSASGVLVGFLLIRSSEDAPFMPAS